MKRTDRVLAACLCVGFFLLTWFRRGAMLMKQVIILTNDTLDEQHMIRPSDNSTDYYIPTNGMTFAPGSLTFMSRLETFHRCFVDPHKYQHHLQPFVKCSISPHLKYFMIAKAGSSTCRHVMKHSLQGVEERCLLKEQQQQRQDDTKKFRFTMVREPTSRFYSAYQEAFQRSRRNVQKIPNQYRSFLVPFENMKRGVYQTMVQSNSTRNQEKITTALETFVRDYDAHNPFDGHLRLQIPRLFDRNTGRTIPLDAIYDSNDMNASFQDIATKIGIQGDIPVIHAYNRGDKRMNLSGISNAARMKICQLSAIDYCCLNYELPPECQGVVTCQWVSKPRVSSKELLIEPVSLYPPSL